MEQVILVNEHDQAIGTEEKLAAHEKALCHRAFSVFVCRQQDSVWQLLLQQRHPEKYHAGGLWTNTCCGHPRPAEETMLAATRRLKEEMGFNVELKEVGVFHYIAKFENGLTENEIDHVFIGYYNNEIITPDEKEIHHYIWEDFSTLHQKLKSNPENYTPWFKQALLLAEKNLLK